MVSEVVWYNCSESSTSSPNKAETSTKAIPGRTDMQRIDACTARFTPISSREGTVTSPKRNELLELILSILLFPIFSMNTWTFWQLIERRNTVMFTDSKICSDTLTEQSSVPETRILIEISNACVNYTMSHLCNIAHNSWRDIIAKTITLFKADALLFLKHSKSG